MTRFDEVLAALEHFTLPPGGTWTPGQVLVHCAQSVEFSLAGFPKPRGFLVQKVIGPVVMRRFLSKGALTHDLTAEIPGAPSLGAPSLEEGKARLTKAIADFRAHQGALQPHFAYGHVEREPYEALHAMHFADHLRAP
jgi:Protein of unknown function (DUF1569)